VRRAEAGVEQSSLTSRQSSLAALSRRTQRAQSVSHHLLVIVPPLLLGVVILVIWFAGTSLGHVQSLILPAPGDVFASLGAGLSSGLFFSNALVTIEESLVGFLLAVAIGLPLGYCIAKWRLFAATVQPYLAAGQAIPAIVIAPVLYLLLGYGIVPIIILCALIVLFPMVITTALGFQTIDPALVDAARVEGASGWPMLAKIEFPLALPAILAAVRTGLTLSITGALVGEFVVQGASGLGALVLVSTDQFNTPQLFATLLVLAFLAALYYTASWLLVKLANAIY
ncbi:MAG TPA: ABC transporter permease, partial [Ktedonobacteraceae bacterium]|nr:ABC transporter permease [Ktedonobacteraceae bacterium]